MRQKLTDNDVAQLLCVLIIILVVLWYATTRAEALDTMCCDTPDLISTCLPIRYVTQATYDLVLEELELERDMRDSLEHKLFLQENSNRVLREELTAVRGKLEQALLKIQYLENKQEGK